MGLSIPHNSPQHKKRIRTWHRIEQAAGTARPRPEMQVPVGGALLRVRAAQVLRGLHPYGRRGRVTRFSRAARKRMLEKLMCINRGAVRNMPLMITLTYPASWPSDPATWKEHLHAFVKRLTRRFVDTAVVWKLELQRRGAPHFHLLIFGPPWIALSWAAKAWFDVVRSGDPRHLSAGTRVERVRSWGGVISYAAKYLGKLNGEGDPRYYGRYWGVIGAKNLPIELFTFPLTFGEFFAVRRLIYKLMAARMKTQALRGYGGTGGPPMRVRGEHQGVTVYTSFQQALTIINSVATTSTSMDK